MAAAVSANWAAVEQRANRKAEAAADFEKALAVLNTTGSDLQPLRQSIMQHYTEVLKALHRKAAPSLNTFVP